MLFQSKRRFERDCKEADRAQHYFDKVDADINVTKADVEKVWITCVSEGEETDPIINPSFFMTAFILFCESVWMIPLWNDGRWYNRCQVPTSHLIPHLLLSYSTFSVLQKIPILLKKKLDSMHNKSVTKLVPANILLFFHLALGRYLKQIYIFSLNQTNQIISYSMPGFKNVNRLLFYCTQKYIGKIINWSFSMNTRARQYILQI